MSVRQLCVNPMRHALYGMKYSSKAGFAKRCNLSQFKAAAAAAAAAAVAPHINTRENNLYVYS